MYFNFLLFTVLVQVISWAKEKLWQLIYMVDVPNPILVQVPQALWLQVILFFKISVKIFDKIYKLSFRYCGFDFGGQSWIDLEGCSAYYCQNFIAKGKFAGMYAKILFLSIWDKGKFYSKWFHELVRMLFSEIHCQFAGMYSRLLNKQLFDLMSILDFSALM